MSRIEDLKNDLDFAEKQLELYIKLYRFPKDNDVTQLQNTINEANEDYMCCILGC